MAKSVPRIKNFMRLINFTVVLAIIAVQSTLLAIIIFIPEVLTPLKHGMHERKNSSEIMVHLAFRCLNNDREIFLLG